jgi:hypothetical protein
MVSLLLTWNAALDRLALLLPGRLIPTFASLAAFVMTTWYGFSSCMADILGRLFGPALTLIGSIIRNELLPALTELLDLLRWQVHADRPGPGLRFRRKLAEGIRLATDKFEPQSLNWTISTRKLSQ